MENETKKEGGNVLVFLILLILLTWAGVFTFNHFHSKPAKDVGAEEIKNCTTDLAWHGKMTKTECEKITKDDSDKLKRINEKGNLIGCNYNYPHCGGKDHKTFKLEVEDENWIETDDSKLCASYSKTKVADLPVACLNYWGINNK